ncbi:MAG TPA: hypothetical protein VLE91_03500 [Candidatus Saccharimonadales bacterium]|nr:hypothetical protein [Candidatus Saccharimonadales bacterium]
MYAEVVVLTYQAPDIQTFTYEIPKELEGKIKIGQLVSVPFGKRNPYGVIMATRSVLSDASPRTDLVKKITSIVIEQPLLLPHQTRLLDWMTNYYHASTVNCLEAMLPQIPRDPRSDLSVGQTLVLVPSINQLPQTMAQFSSKNFALYHSDLKPKEKFAIWQKIANGNYDFVFGTRSAIFTPCPKLKEIIIFDEHDGAYKDERSPYFSTLTIAQKLQELTGCSLKIIDTSPKVTTYFNLGTRADLVQPRSALDKEIKTQIVSMVEERQGGNFSPLSDILQNYIKGGVLKQKKILLFLNKKAESGHIYCKNCKYSNFAKVEPETCPECNSTDIFFNTTNVNSLATVVRKLVPNVKVNIIAKASGSDPDAGSDPASVDIATASVFYKLLLFRYDLVAHVYTDALLNIVDFATNEKLYQQITNLKKITKGLLLLQTFSPNDPTIHQAADGNYKKFFQKEIEQRKNLSYPPFALLVKLTQKGKIPARNALRSMADRDQKVEEKSQVLFEKLSGSQFAISNPDISILGPFKPTFSGKSSKYNIIVKIPIENYDLKSKGKAVDSIAPLFDFITHDWQIEIETESIND